MNSQKHDHKFIKVGGFNTRYIEAGTPGNSQLVLLHDGGFGATAKLSWGDVIDLLGGEFHIFAPELLGWGGTDKAVFLDRSPYQGRIPHITDFVAAIGIENATFVGASFGGSMILRAAVESGNPWKIRKAVSISGTGGPFRSESGMEALSELSPDIESARRFVELVVGHTEGMENQIEGRLEGCLIPGHWESMMAPRIKNPALSRSGLKDPYLEQIRSLSIPTLLVSGKADPLVEGDWAKRLAALSDKITTLELEAGHEPNIDKPELVADLIRQYHASS